MLLYTPRFHSFLVFSLVFLFFPLFLKKKESGKKTCAWLAEAHRLWGFGQRSWTPPRLGGNVSQCSFCSEVGGSMVVNFGHVVFAQVRQLVTNLNKKNFKATSGELSQVTSNR